MKKPKTKVDLIFERAAERNRKTSTEADTSPPDLKPTDWEAIETAERERHLKEFED
jgi:hypothetical protein